MIDWLPIGHTCIKWDGLLSDFFRLDVGVRQDSIVAPFCFAICINDTIKLCMKCRLGDILVYADDILLIARSVTGLQRMILIIENYLNWLDLSINCAKSCCMRIGKRFNCPCANIISRTGSLQLFHGLIMRFAIKAFIWLLLVNLNALSLMLKKLFVEQSTLFLVKLDLIPTRTSYFT